MHGGSPQWAFNARCGLPLQVGLELACRFPFALQLPLQDSMMVVSRLLLVGILAGSLTFAGCGSSGPELGNVHGTIKMDGQPLKLADVMFRRKDFTGRPSTGMTDENGYYTLG